MCDQQSLRSACAYAQSDQSLCLSLEYSMSVKLLTEQHLEFLSIIGGCTGSSESALVKLPHCWKSHVTAHMFQDDGFSASNRIHINRQQCQLRICNSVQQCLTAASEDLIDVLPIQSHMRCLCQQRQRGAPEHELLYRMFLRWRLSEVW